MLFRPIPPYDFALTADAARLMYVMAEFRDGALRRVLRVGDRLALVEVVGRGTTGAPLLEARLLASDGRVDRRALWPKVRRLLNVDADLGPFLQAAARDPALSATVARLHGLHTLRADSLFESVALAMIEQQISLKQAHRGERWLLAWGGARLDCADQPYFAFPSAERLAAATVDELRPLKITFGRMQRLIDWAKACSGQAPFVDEPADLLYERLRGVKGVGHWTAAWALARLHGRHVHVGAADVALQAAVNAYHFGCGGRADPRTVDATFERYGEHAGLAAFYTLTRWAIDRDVAGLAPT